MKNFLKIIAGSFIGSLLAILIGGFLMIGIISSIASLSSSTKPTVPASAVLVMDFKLPITEQGEESPFSPDMLFSDAKLNLSSSSILNMLQTLDRAAADPSIKFLYMNLNQIQAGVTHIEELRAAILKFRESGKAVIAYADNYSQGAYYLATAADKVYINPYGSATLTGLSISTMFFKDLLDRAGVEAQLIRHGKFKAAAEQFISNKMSEENREQLKAYLDAVWNTWTTDIAASRSISKAKIDSITDNLVLTTAQKALDNKLVDGLLYKDELSDTLAHLFGVETEKEVDYINITAYSRATAKVNLKEKNKIAVIYANGEILMGKSDNNITSDHYAALLADVRKDSTIKAVVFRVNSPGGSAQSADIIERELKLLKKDKPVVVSFGDYAASGGYWISANADKIITNNTTLTGSIGVFSMALNIQKALNKHLSINTGTVNTNKHSDFMSGYRPLDKEEVAFMQSAVEVIYTDFINLVAKGRGMTPEKVDSVAQGRVWSGADALKIGLADERGGILSAIDAAAAMASLEGYRIVEYPVRKSQIEKLMESLSETEAAAKVLNNPYFLLEKAYSALKKEKGVKTMARIPYNLEFNL
ncbi:MAG: signal peptide peptidase SppA [Bacteroidales bacterium]|jgi:protease-4